MQLPGNGISGVEKGNPHLYAAEGIKYIDYGAILKACQLPYKEESHWLYAGKRESISNQLFYVTVCVSQAPAFFPVAFGVLKKYGTAFRVIRDTFFHYQLNGGHFGSEEIGKILTIWPSSLAQTRLLLNELVPRLVSLKGPSVMGNCYKTGHVFYFPVNNKKQQSIINCLKKDYPFTFFAYPQKTKLIGRYIPVKMLKYSPKGNVYKGYSLKMLNFCPWLIKEGRANMAEDGAGRDVKHRLVWEKMVLDEIYGSVNAPKAKGYFEQKENGYLVLEWLEGASLGDAIRNLRGDKTLKQLLPEDKRKIFSFLLTAISNIKKLHNTGYVHRDLNENNFIVSQTGDIFIIDFEIAYNIKTNNPRPAFYYGMPGYAAPEQAHHAIPTFKEDIYSIGVLITSLITDIRAIEIETMQRDRLKNIINNRMQEKTLGEMLVRCLNGVPKKRPEITELEKSLKAFII